MSEYYDKQRFTGGQRPPQKKKNDEINWVVLIILFSVGLWPIALIYLGWKWLFDNKEETTDEKLRRAQRQFDNAIDSALKGVSNAEGAFKTAAQDLKDAAGTVAKSVTEAADKAKAAKAAPRPERKDSTSRKATARRNKIFKKVESLGKRGVVWQIVGAFVLFAATAALGEVVDDYIWLQTLEYSIETLVVGLNMLAAGGAMLGHGISLNRFSKRSRKYLAAVGEADSISIDLIARRAGCGYKRTVKDLEKMIDRGFFGEDAYLDLELGYFLRFGSAVEQQGVKQEEPAMPQEEVKTESDYERILREIRHANDRIDDEALSAKIDRLEQITGQILRVLEKHPEKRAKMNTFFSYYLPTTQKLLNAYADFEETGVEGANLSDAKERIEQTMDSIVAGFAHQLDELYKADAMDVATDIKVMESMLQRDTGSAARDFGYEKYQQQQ